MHSQTVYSGITHCSILDNVVAKKKDNVNVITHGCLREQTLRGTS